MQFPAKADIKEWYQSGDWTLSMVQDALNLRVISQNEFEEIIKPVEYPPIDDQGVEDRGSISGV
ncbi:XkdX family protein [Latilactobacillus curvatus]|uniref:XkdX family protein n=1 Tax=Latilactobacillus curvatus TaxID=28038 RepID=UPI0024DFE532|nr:XkdX family protein [Latilactobacillus curvatus]WIE01465.1 XkdX family protein [Latilactobacillus curvatus]